MYKRYHNSLRQEYRFLQVAFSFHIAKLYSKEGREE